MSAPRNPISREYLGDRRLLLVLPRALVLQVGHPVVAAGVAEHSSFREDPWGRLERTLSMLFATAYGPDPAAASRDLRALHKQIRGVDAHGRRYHALEPEAYFWVLATTHESVVEMARRFAKPLRGGELERFYAETCEAGRMLGLRDRDMPRGWPAFKRYYAEMLHTRLEDNEVVHEVLGQLARPACPPQLALLERLAWRGLGALSGHVLQLATFGTLPAVARERWGLSWRWTHEQQLALLARAVRTAVGSLPRERRLMAGALHAEGHAGALAEPC